MRPFVRGLVALLVVLAGAGGVGADDRTAGAPPQLAQHWDELSPDERDEARRNYERFRNLPPEQRRAVEENYDRWRQLPPGEKERIRGNYQQYRRMSPEERRAFERGYRRWREERR